MRRIALVVLAAVSLLVPALAQERPTGPPRGQPRQRARPGDQTERLELKDEAKLRYVAKQLDLTPEQQSHFEGLLELYRETIAQGQDDAIQSLQKLRELMTELNAAQQAGDSAKADAIREQMSELRTQGRAEKELFTGLAKVLTPEQKTALDQVLERLRKNPDVSLKPGQVVRIALGLGLSPEQEKQFQKIQADLRTTLRDTPMSPAFDRKTQEKLLTAFIAAVRGILTPDQLGRFDKQIDKVRPDVELEEDEEAEGAAGPGGAGPASKPAGGANP